MSSCTIDEETKLKDALAEKLEKSGFLNELKAKLGVKIFQTLENDLELSGEGDNGVLDDLPKTTTTLCLEPYLQSDEGTLALYLVQDMLDSLGLHYSSMIFKTEIGGDLTLYKKRSETELQNILRSIHDKIEVNNSSKTLKFRPLLVEIVHKILRNQTSQQCDGSNIYKNNVQSKAN